MMQVLHDGLSEGTILCQWCLDISESKVQSKQCNCIMLDSEQFNVLLVDSRVSSTSLSPRPTTREHEESDGV